MAQMTKGAGGREQGSGERQGSGDRVQGRKRAAPSSTLNPAPCTLNPAQPGRLLARGAEAELRLVGWMGRKAVAKTRVPKPYRLPELDYSLRQSRTRSEARLLRAGRSAGVPTPLVYDVDLAEDACILTMEFIEGEQVKHLLNRLPMPRSREMSRSIGRMVGLLHRGGIVHGDLTTSNMLWCSSRMYFIDFGLGALTDALEAQGVDLRVLKEAFGSTHAHIGRCFDEIIKGYVGTYRNGPEAVARMEEIAARGRYTD